MKKLALICLAFLFVMGLAVNSGAADKNMSGGPHGGMYKQEGGCGCGGPHSHMAMFKKLGLDEKQKETIKQIHFKTMKEMVKKRADIKVAKIELREILSKDPLDMAAAESAVKKIEGLKVEMKMMHIKTMEEIKSNLNPEQRKKFIEMIGMMVRHHGAMKGNCSCGMHGMGPMKEKAEMKHKHN